MAVTLYMRMILTIITDSIKTACLLTASNSMSFYIGHGPGQIPGVFQSQHSGGTLALSGVI